MERSWLVADTVRTDRKDIFSLIQGEEHHVGTLISGSRYSLDRFESEVCLIRQSPDMRRILEELVSLAKSNELNEQKVRQLSVEAMVVLNEISSVYIEG